MRRKSKTSDKSEVFLSKIQILKLKDEEQTLTHQNIWRTQNWLKIVAKS